jgi:cytochrome c5
MNTTTRLLFSAAILSGGLATPLAAAEEPASAPPQIDPGNKLDMRKGMQVYKSACARCHAKGKDGAPRLRDSKAWASRDFQSFSVMQKHADKGFLAMPAKGIRPNLTDQDMANAVFYMLERINTESKK